MIKTPCLLCRFIGYKFRICFMCSQYDFYKQSIWVFSHCCYLYNITVLCIAYDIIVARVEDRVHEPKVYALIVFIILKYLLISNRGLTNEIHCMFILRIFSHIETCVFFNVQLLSIHFYFLNKINYSLRFQWLMELLGNDHGIKRSNSSTVLVMGLYIIDNTIICYCHTTPQ